MEKTEKIFLTLVLIACVGIIIFWVAGFNEQNTIALYAITAAGVLCTIAIGVKIIGWLRHHNLY